MVRNLTEALRFVVFRLTQIQRISDFLLMVENLTEDGGVVWGCCLITPSALSAPITKAHTDSTRFTKIICKKFVAEKNTYLIH